MAFTLAIPVVIVLAAAVILVTAIVVSHSMRG